MAVDKTKLQEEGVVRFYKIILSWNYSRLLTESQKNSKKGGIGLQKVKDTYIDVEDYLSTFEPLLFEEVKAQIVQRKDDDDEEQAGNSFNSQLVAIAECSDTDGFYFPAVHYIENEGESLSQNDLLILSRRKLEDDPKIHAFALIEHRQPGILRLRMFLGGEIKKFDTDRVETSPRLVEMASLVRNVKHHLHMVKVCSLSTILREYIALRSIKSLPFKELILKAADEHADSADHAWRIPPRLMDFIESNHNESQVQAIKAGLSRKSFVLIQGPPGTGKTQTILGLLSAILHSTPARIHVKEQSSGMKEASELPLEEKYKHWKKASPWLGAVNPRDAIMPIDGDDGFYPTSGSELKPEVVDSSRKYRVRVLVCAPSNSALDEIVSRVLTAGVHDENVHAYNPKIVRIGLKAHHSVKSVSMDYLVEQKLAGLEGHQPQDKQKQAGGNDRDSVRSAVLDEAVIVFSTLSFSGSSVLSKLSRVFDIVIIDEAAQAVEPATLVPLMNGCKQVFLVGDPVQLPATVISPVAEKLGYGTSLFKRLQRAGYPVFMLKTQYRMHPQIRSFPSREFYADALEDGCDIEDQTRRSWHDYTCFGPFCFFDLHEGQESQPAGSGSWVNFDEVEFVLLMYQKLIDWYPDLKESSKLAIISPYRRQVKLFRQQFKDKFGIDSENRVDINTVDGFQGREKDVAIFSCVRASKDGGIGFVADFRRMNVGITRARSSILVVGSASALKKDEHWNNLIKSAEEKKSLFKVSKPYASFFNVENLKSMEVKKESAREPIVDDEVDTVLYGNHAVAEEEQPDDNDYGDGDDMGFDED